MYNQLTITKVSNGFIVSLPRPIKGFDPIPSFMQNINFNKHITDFIRMKDEDLDTFDIIEKILPGIMHDITATSVPPETESVDEYTHIFTEWDGVIAFLKELELA